MMKFGSTLEKQMEHGLPWLALLATFGILTLLGSREYRKLEAYRLWARDFDRAKYDVRAALGWKGSTLTWGRPTPTGICSQSGIDLDGVEHIRLLVDGRVRDPESLPPGRPVELEFLPQGERIPFQDRDMALAWWGALQRALGQDD